MKLRTVFPWARSAPTLKDDFAQSAALRARHGRFAKPQASSPSETVFPAEVTRLMKLAEQEAGQAGTPRPCNSFTARDVVAIYTYHQDEGEGVWFRLQDGRVFSSQGEPSTTNPAIYKES